MEQEIYHLIGIGGIGMSALARILLQKGVHVEGSDLAQTDLIVALQQEGIRIVPDSESIDFQKGMTVVYTSALNETHPGLQKAKNMGLPVLHRADLLHRVMQDKKAILVTGTHGKTTTTALMAHVLVQAGKDPSFVVGGVMRGLGTNGHQGQGDYFIAEADESDGSFLRTPAWGAIVTNLEDEHLDFWKTSDQLTEGFRKFCEQVDAKDKLFWCLDDGRLKDLNVQGISYGFDPDAELQVTSFNTDREGIVFDLKWKEKIYSKVKLPLWGAHNALNGAAVFGLALNLGVLEEDIRKAFREFQGVTRRLEWKGEQKGLTVYDDYGHHPTEIRATLKALRKKVFERRIVVIFQPHRWTRLKEYKDLFIDSFEEADVVVGTNVYSAQEPPIEGISNASFYEDMKQKLKDKLIYVSKGCLEEEVIQYLRPLDVVLTLGAGDITSLGPRLLDSWAQKGSRLKVALLFGGVSVEHDISVISATSVLSHLDRSFCDVELFGIHKQGKWIVGSDALQRIQEEPQPGPHLSEDVLSKLLLVDVCLPILHGPYGEDGRVQGFLETLQIPYVGCNVESSALCMEKGWTKNQAMLNQIPTAHFLSLDRHSYEKEPEKYWDMIEQTLKYPVWIKPVHLGSSIGVTCVASKEEMKEAFRLAFHLDERVIIEEHVEGRQIEFAVMGNRLIRVAEPAEILSDGAFYSYETKYGSGGFKVRIPAAITPLEKEVGMDLAQRAYQACGCEGLARVDFFLDTKGYYWLNEINPIPGFTLSSAYPKMWEAAGMSPQELWNELMALAFHRSWALKKQGPCAGL